MGTVRCFEICIPWVIIQSGHLSFTRPCYGYFLILANKHHCPWRNSNATELWRKGEDASGWPQWPPSGEAQEAFVLHFHPQRLAFFTDITVSISCSLCREECDDHKWDRARNIRFCDISHIQSVSHDITISFSFVNFYLEIRNMEKVGWGDGSVDKVLTM